MSGWVEVRSWAGLASLTVAVGMLLFAAAAPAAEAPTRDEYKAKVEPICKANTKANEQILGGVRKQVKEGKLKPAGAQFLKAATALKKTRTQLLAVPQPSADTARLKSWLGDVKTLAGLFEGAGRKLKAEDKPGANRFVSKLLRTANQANAQVISFEFSYCRFEPSRFT